MVATKVENGDASATQRDNTPTAGSSALASERFRLDIPDIFGAAPGKSLGSAGERNEPLRLAEAGKGQSASDSSSSRSNLLADSSATDKQAGTKPSTERARESSIPSQRRAGIEKNERASESLNEKQYSDFARNNGLDVSVRPDKKLEFSVMNGGEKMVLGTVEPTKAGLDEVSRSIKELSELKKWDLQQRFNIQFGKPGEQSLRQQVPQKDGSNKPGQKLDLREPTVRELLGVEAALEKANPSHISQGSKPLTFYFLKDKTLYEGSGGVATFEPKINGGPAVVVEPKSLLDSPITEKDRQNNDFTNHRSIASIMMHELGHHTEERINKTESQKADTYRQIGWTPIPGKPRLAGGEQQWMLKGPNGEGYAPASLARGDWVRFDSKGREVGLISPEQAAANALVKPSTQYFEGPHEMFSEGLTMLRVGDNHRSHLMNRDQTLYQTIKAADQRDIDKTYGAGNFMRSYSGLVVPRNAENLKALEEREQRERR